MSAVLQYPFLAYRHMIEVDLPTVLNIEERAYEYPWTLGIFRDCIQVGYSCWVVECETSVVGYVVFSIVLDECNLLNLCVDPNFQNRGFGRQILNKLLIYSQQQDVNTVYLEVRPSNRKAILLYYSEGFNEVGTRKNYYPARAGMEDAVILAKTL